MQDAEVASSRLGVIALTEEGASLSRAAIFAMGGIAGRYRIESEHLLSEMPALLRLLEGKDWKHARSEMELRQKGEEPPVRRPAAGTPGSADHCRGSGPPGRCQARLQVCLSPRLRSLASARAPPCDDRGGLPARDRRRLDAALPCRSRPL